MSLPNGSSLRLLLATVGLALLLWIVWDSGTTTEPSPTAEERTRSSTSRRALAPPASSPVPTPVVSTADEEPELTPAATEAVVEKAKQTLALYQKTTVYPFWSRPANGSTMHIIEWNKVFPVGQAWAADADGDEIRADLTLSQLFAGPGETIEAYLTVTKVRDGSPFVPDEMAGRVEYYDTASNVWRSADEVRWTARQGAWVAEINPTAMPVLTKEAHEVHFVTYLRQGEDFEKKLRIPFLYAAEEPIRMRGLAGDRVAAGSLEVKLDVEVLHLGPTLVQAGLFDERGERPIAVFDDYFRPTYLGRQTWTLRFFGRAIRESGISGPYRIRALHGHVRPDGRMKELFYAFPDEPPMLTGTYSAEDFSDDEWNAPERNEKIARYREFIEEVQTGEP